MIIFEFLLQMHVYVWLLDANNCAPWDLVIMSCLDGSLLATAFQRDSPVASDSIHADTSQVLNRGDRFDPIFQRNNGSKGISESLSDTDSHQIVFTLSPLCSRASRYFKGDTFVEGAESSSCWFIVAPCIYTQLFFKWNRKVDHRIARRRRSIG